MPDVETNTVSFATNGDQADGFLARPSGSGPFPGVVVVQEWWGINDHIKDIAQRFAREGFAALAPDLYHGQVTKEPGEAQKLMMSLQMEDASREVSRAVDYLASQPFTAGRGIGAIGFCMGGGLALLAACDNPKIGAVGNFYGTNPSPIEKVANLRGPVFAAFAENDAFANQSMREALERAMQEHGKQFDTKVYPGTEHAFFNDTRPEVYNKAAAEDAWQRVLKLLKEGL